MKIMLLSMVALISISVAAAGQTVAAAGPTGSAGGQGNAELAQVALYSVQGHNGDWTRSSISFETGERGFRGRSSPEYDMTYGNMSTSTGGKGGVWFRDWLSVRDPRSIILDLGEKKWEDFRQTPFFPKSQKWRQPLPLNSPMVVNTSAGREIDAPDASKAVSPHRQFVLARLGHMYLMKVMKGRNATYVVFRVDRLSPGDTCLLSWKKVPPPPDDDVEK